MPQTNISCSQGAEAGPLNRIVVINKIRPPPRQAQEETWNPSLTFPGAEAMKTAQFSLLYGVGSKRLGNSGIRMSKDLVLCSVASTTCRRPSRRSWPATSIIQMLVDHFGSPNELFGRIRTADESGVITTNRNIKVLNRDGENHRKRKRHKLLACPVWRGCGGARRGRRHCAIAVWKQPRADTLLRSR